VNDSVSLLSIAGSLQRPLTNYALLLSILKTQWGCHTLTSGYAGEVGVVMEMEQYE
jgi:hypothetical protein